MPPQALNTIQFNQLVKDWYDTDGELKSGASPAFTGIAPFVVEGRTFLLAVKFISRSGYPVVLGFYEDTAAPPRLHCRHFYRSNSESAWRVGTGFRANGAWVKGAEGHPQDMGGGYIFEGQVHHLLDKALQDMAPTIEDVNRRGFELFAAASSGLIPAPYMVQGGACSQVVNDYAHERQVQSVLPQAVWEDDPLLKAYNVPVLLKQSQVQFQTTVQNKVRSVPSSDDSDNYAARLKKSEKLWTFLKGCLANKIDSYTFTHAALGEVCTVDRFRLVTVPGNVCIEIAYSENKKRDFKTNSGVQCSINSPICWVKSVYFPDSVSTYGNYTQYPEDLCFLVQKPMDYVIQTTAEVNKRMGVAVRGAGRTLQVDDRARTNIAENLRKGGTYLMLALYDEKYSPLIQEFKAKMRFPLFKWKSQKFLTSGAEVAIKRIFKDTQDNFAKLKQDTLDACDDYLALPTNDQHTERGKAKARTFKAYVTNVTTYANLNAAIYQLFAKNNIGNTSYYLVRIRVKAHSLFSIFCRRMLANYFELDLMESVCRGQAFNGLIDKVYNKYKGRAFANNALERFALAAMKNQLIPKGNSLAETERQLLLDAVKDV